LVIFNGHHSTAAFLHGGTDGLEIDPVDKGIVNYRG